MGRLRARASRGSQREAARLPLRRHGSVQLLTRATSTPCGAAGVPLARWRRASSSPLRLRGSAAERFGSSRRERTDAAEPDDRSTIARNPGATAPPPRRTLGRFNLEIRQHVSPLAADAGAARRPRRRAARHRDRADGGGRRRSAASTRSSSSRSSPVVDERVGGAGPGRAAAHRRPRRRASPSGSASGTSASKAR